MLRETISVSPWNRSAWRISDEIVNGICIIIPSMAILLDVVAAPRPALVT